MDAARRDVMKLLNVDKDAAYRRLSALVRRGARERAGLTQAQLAKQLGLSTQFISTVERGAAGASVETIISLCDALNVSADRLLRGESGADAEHIAGKLSALPESRLGSVDRLVDEILKLSAP